MNKRTQYTAEYKTSVVLRVLREEETVAEIAASEGLNPVMISRPERTSALNPWKHYFRMLLDQYFGVP